MHNIMHSLLITMQEYRFKLFKSRLFAEKQALIQ